PTTGLFANWTIVNVPGTLTWTGQATAIVAKTTIGGTAGAGNLVMHPQTNATVAAATATARTSDPLLAGGYRTMSALGVGTTAIDAPIQAALFDFPDLSTPYVVVTPGTPVIPTVQALELTQSLAATSFTNEYLTEPTINAKTDWVFSAPTRRYSVGLNYKIVSPDTTFTEVFSVLTQTYNGLSPLNGSPSTTYYHTDNTSVDTGLGQICVKNVNPTYQDREENVPVDVTDFVISPGALGAPLTFCGEVSVLSFNNTAGASVVGALIARKDIDLLYRNGWATIATPGNNGIGLPILGSAFMSAFNGAASAGVSGNYGLSFAHRYERVSAP
ncbi:MAG: cell surface protein, partial [Pseudomonadota bacterium]|nr:cell surface protein [Pseudomonadota bacterium]